MRNSASKFLFSVLSLALLVSVNCDGWHYLDAPGGPSSWGGFCAEGTQQSPIDIRSSEAVKADLGGLSFANYHLDLKGGKVTNNGHSIVVSPAESVVDVPFMSGAGLKGKYSFAQLHLHWGSTSTKGSEHLVDGKAYPLELHLVHYNSKYPDIATAVGQEDGLAVLGIFFHLSSKDNPHLQPILDSVSDILQPFSEATLSKSLTLKSLLPEDTKSFYRYFGSLTTPGCFESVTWTVFEKSIPVSQSQLSKLRTLIDTLSNKMADNFRPTLNLNRRFVIKSKPTKKQEGMNPMMMMMAMMMNGGTDVNGMMSLMMMLQQGGSNNMMLPLIMMMGNNGFPPQPQNPSNQQQ